MPSANPAARPEDDAPRQRTQPTEEPQLLRLKRVEVDRLFGLYDHHFDLNLDDRITILHGPNGVGKTTVLRLIDGLLRYDFAHIRRVPFTRLRLGFHDGSDLELTTTDHDANRRSAELTLRSHGAPPRSWNVTLQPSEAEIVANKVDYLRPHGAVPGFWIDVRYGDMLSETDVLGRFAASRPLLSRATNAPSWIQEWLDSANTYLIEAQRLFRTPWDPCLRDGGRSPGHSLTFTFTPRVEESSLDFQTRLRNVMARYAQITQRLDQTFPQRLVSANTERLPEDALQALMDRLNEMKADFHAIGILDKAPAPFDAEELRDMDDAQARVMALYLKDTELKLAALVDLARRAVLFLRGVNAKFRNKRVRLDRERGLLAETADGVSLPLGVLSSGEQHEILLHYDLLFRVRPNTVVLIDEPELSLHVGWQTKFLSDLKNTIELCGFDTVIATHSPYIAGDGDDLMVALADSR